MDDQPPRPRIVKFQLGRSTVSAFTEVNKHDPSHILRLRVHLSVWQQVLRWCIFRLPRRSQMLAGRIWPALFLPAEVLLKKLKPDWDDEFNNEKCMYSRLEALQGDVIPIFYGEVQCEGTRALLLSIIHGVVSCQQTPPYLEPDEFQRRLEVAYKKMRAFGLSYDDTKLRNVLLVDDKIVFVDLEWVWEPEPTEMDYACETCIYQFTRDYKLYLQSDDKEEWAAS